MSKNSKLNISKQKDEYTITATDVYPSTEKIKNALQNIDFAIKEIDEINKSKSSKFDPIYRTKDK